ncbi:hypothetical protein P171DRAFT_481207 [Karstenula rhodostoma CBS 690.94]|uniref:C2H2-type domain-containing protein n=1 Tax=Karstenula rhodostoma CBS 690.94 TaxID=1392251 RepID=A0A9P4PRV9_9PLEO|nr:hypothetical protein P171DRAFT_481207 [Karstenula rhodostoma CBS 690.94]
MEGDQTNQGPGGAATAVGTGARAGLSGEHADYGFSLPSANADIQVRYVDRRDDPSSYPHWVITDNTTPKYDPNRGFWSSDRKKADSDSKAGTSTTAKVANDEAGAVSRKGKDASLPDILVESIRNEELLNSGTMDLADQDFVVGAAVDWETVASDAEDEEEPELPLSGAAATTSPSSIRVSGLQLSQANSPSPVSNSSRSNNSKDSIPTPHLGTARANRLARAAARQAKLSKPTADVSLHTSAEAQRIVHAAQSDSTYNVDEAVARVRLNRDLGIRIRKNNPTYAPLANENGNREDEVIDDAQDNGITAESLSSRKKGPGRSDKAKEADEADWIPSRKSRIPAQGRPGKQTQGAKQRGRPRTPDPTMNRPFICSTCLAAFIRREHLKRHEKSLHSGERSHVCEVCGRAFTRGDNLKQHMQIHTEDDGQEVAAGTVEQTSQLEGAVPARQILSQFSRETAEGMAYQTGPFEEAVRAQQMLMGQNHQRLEGMGKL